jgi:hypothetical protein
MDSLVGLYPEQVMGDEHALVRPIGDGGASHVSRTGNQDQTGLDEAVFGVGGTVEGKPFSRRGPEVEDLSRREERRAETAADLNALQTGGLPDFGECTQPGPSGFPAFYGSTDSKALAR